jgi:NNP family nitrate/nitrite transporter-like MFS transporter
MYCVAGAALVLVSAGLPRAWMALAAFIPAMLALGAGNGAIFQLVPQRFREEVGVMTGIVGCTGGLGGFYLASSLGYPKQLSGSYRLGFLLFVALAFVALAALALTGLTSIKRRWRTTWSAALAGAARI